MKWITLLAILTAAAFLQSPVRAADSGKSIDEITVTADRVHSNLVSPARQTQIIDKQEFDLKINAGGTVAELLAATVPGLAPPSQTLSEYSLKLRGRSFLTMVDGIPLLTNRNASRNLINVSPHEIERIEVVRGGNAVYGSGATGGVVSLTTLTPTAGHEQSTRIGLSKSLTSSHSDGLGYEFSQVLTGRLDAFDYVFSGSFDHAGSNYDADGRRIAPEVSQGDLFDSDAVSALLKIGKDIDEDRRIQFRFSRFNAEQDTNYASDPDVNDEPLRSLNARAIEGLQLGEQNQVYNLLVSGDYFQRNLLVGDLHALAYYRDHETRFYPFDSRTNARNPHLSQTILTSELAGIRLTMNTPLDWIRSGSTELLWGLDWNSEEASMPITTYDLDAYDDSGGLVFVKTGDKVYMPPITHDSIASFVQLRSRLNDAWSVDTGLRYEQIDMAYDEFITLPQTLEPDPIVTSGGSISYDALLFNVGVVFTPVDGQELYASFTQGFEQPDAGLRVRNAEPDFDISQSQLDAIQSDNYEIGWRGNWDGLSAALSFFHSTSDLGGVTTSDFGLTMTRSAERITGAEATFNITFNEKWSAGGTYTIIDGDEKSGTGTKYVDMHGFRVPPATVNVHLDWTPSERITSTMLMYHVDGEDFRINGVDAFGRRTSESYTTANVVGSYEMPKGSLHFAIENIFNRDYHTLYGQLLRSFNNQSHIPARGRLLRLAYTYKW